MSDASENSGAAGERDWSAEFNAGAQKPLRVHLIGVAGSGMSGLASLFLRLGHRVSGSDRVTTEETEDKSVICGENGSDRRGQ